MRSSILRIAVCSSSLAVAAFCGGCTPSTDGTDAGEAVRSADAVEPADTADTAERADPTTTADRAATTETDDRAATTETDDRAETTETSERVPDDWETFADASAGVSFRYPRELGTTYVRALDWPPQPLVEPGPFACTEAGEETARAGRTERATIGGRTYCVTRVTEGAAGSVYTMYAYAMPVGDDVVILTFSTRAPQCGNYDEPDRSECERERAAFSMDPIIDAIARTVRVDAPATDAR